MRIQLRAAPTATLTAAPAAVPTSGWRRVFGDWATVGSATAVCHGLGAATSLLLRMLLSPAQMGIWQALKLFLGYGNYANLGISKGAAREYNIALGAGNADLARRGLNLAYAVNTLSSLGYAAVLLGAAFWIAASGADTWTGTWATGLMVIAGLAVLGRYVTFHVTILRTRQAFATTSRLAILEAALTLAVCVPGAWYGGLPGLYAGTMVVMLGSLLFVRRRAAVALHWAWDVAEVRRLIAIGAPILLAGAVATLFRSLDKLMILAYLSDREFQLGCYSLALMVTGQLFGLGNMLSTVTGPRYGEKYGETGDRRVVARLVARCGELHAAAMALPAALALVLAPPVLGRLLPDYQTGLPPLLWLVPGAVLSALALPASQYLVAVGRQRRALVGVLIATGVAAVGNHVALSGGYGLVGVAVATACGYAVYFVLIVGVSFWIELDAADRFRYVASLLLALGPTLATAVCLERSWPVAETDWRATAAKIGVVTLVWVWSVALGWRRGWKEDLRSRRDA
ncbi:MAG: lipopolysaccharide biosynthesis protein [Pirellulales bacterium]|nr:lipopolysaccharide biosynthesis protein [Pirellulales bacterium]